MVKWPKRFAKSEDGISLVEGLIAFPLILLVFATFMEFGFAVFQWNQTVKAVQLGVRRVAVSNPVLTDMSAFTLDYPTDQGGPTPVAAVAVSCGAGASACVDAELNRIVFGSDGACNPAAVGVVIGMCDVFPRITPQNVRITYYRTGLGYVGRPSGPILSATVEIRNLNFDFFFLGRLLGLTSMAIPAHPATITTEDMSSCQYECP